MSIHACTSLSLFLQCTSLLALAPWMVYKQYNWHNDVRMGRLQMYITATNMVCGCPCTLTIFAHGCVSRQHSQCMTGVLCKLHMSLFTSNEVISPDFLSNISSFISLCTLPSEGEWHQYSHKKQGTFSEEPHCMAHTHLLVARLSEASAIHGSD